jgi:hypothetical protein
MGVPTSEVSYTSATAVRGDHEVYKEHVVALEENIKVYSTYSKTIFQTYSLPLSHVALCESSVGSYLTF